MFQRVLPCRGAKLRAIEANERIALEDIVGGLPVPLVALSQPKRQRKERAAAVLINAPENVEEEVQEELPCPINSFLNCDMFQLFADGLPLNRVLKYRQVCKHWESIVWQYCAFVGQLKLKVYSSKRTVSQTKPTKMMLYHTKDLQQYLELPNRDDLSRTLYLRDKYLPEPSGLFPRPHNLMVHFDCYQDLGNLNALFKLLDRMDKVALKSLAFMINAEVITRKLVPRLCELISATLPNLVELHIGAGNMAGKVVKAGESLIQEDIDLSVVLPQLKSFRLDCRVGNQIQQFGLLTPGLLTELSLDCSLFDLDDFRVLIQTGNPDLWAGIQHLSLNFVTKVSALLEKVVERFVGLRYLQLADLYICETKLEAQMIAQLARLPHLTELRLFDYGLNPNVPDTYSLPNVTTLTICTTDLCTRFKRENPLNGEFDGARFCERLSAHFPGLRELNLLASARNDETMLEAVKENLNHFQLLEKNYLNFAVQELW